MHLRDLRSLERPLRARRWRFWPLCRGREVRPALQGNPPMTQIKDSPRRFAQPKSDLPVAEPALPCAFTGRRLRARVTRAMRHFERSRMPLRRARAKGFAPGSAVSAAATGIDQSRSARRINPISARELKGEPVNAAHQTPSLSARSLPWLRQGALVVARRSAPRWMTRSVVVPDLGRVHDAERRGTTNPPKPLKSTPWQ